MHAHITPYERYIIDAVDAAAMLPVITLCYAIDDAATLLRALMLLMLAAAFDDASLPRYIR